MDELSFSRKFVRDFEGGELIFEQDSSAAEMYAILEGAVIISRSTASNPNQFIRKLEKGDIFGEMGLLDDKPRSANARADSSGARVMIIDQPKFVYLVSQQPVFALDIMQLLTQRVRKLEAGDGT